MRARVAFCVFGVLAVGCSKTTSEPVPAPQRSASDPTAPPRPPTPPSPGAGWSLDVKTCERNLIKQRAYEGGGDSLTVVGPDQDVCVVHVKHTVGREWTEADCKIPRAPGTVAIASTAMDRMPGTCTLVESGTDTTR